ncbi:MAG: RadC family protein [Aureispira sp.]
MCGKNAQVFVGICGRSGVALYTTTGPLFQYYYFEWYSKTSSNHCIYLQHPMNVKLSKADKKILLESKDTYSIMQKILLQDDKINQNKEHFWILGLATNNKLLFVELVSLGSVNRTIVEPMDVYSLAIHRRAVKIVLCHNHPSGSLTPSKEDHDITDRLIQGGLILNVPVVDHLIISTTSYVSFEDMGWMKILRDSIRHMPKYAFAQSIETRMSELMEQQIAKTKEKARQNILYIIAQLKKRDMNAKEIAACINLTVREVTRLSIECIGQSK